MKAVVLTRFGNAQEAFSIDEVPTPKMGVDEIRIKVTSFGLNYADVMARKGLYPECPPLPTVLGYEVVGTVLEIGETAETELSVGDRVMSFTRFGGYAQEVCVPAMAAVKVSDSDDASELLCLCTQYATAWYAATWLNTISNGDVVLVHAAAGGVGTALVQIAKNAGASVVGTAGSAKKLEHISANGVDVAINYREDNFYEVLEQKDIRIDVAFDPIAGKNFKQSFKRLNYGGRIVNFGVSARSSSKLLPTLKVFFQTGFYNPIKLMAKSQSILGLNMLKIGDYKPDYLSKILREVYDEYKKGKLKPHVGMVVPIEELNHAHEALENRKTMGKVVVRW